LDFMEIVRQDSFREKGKKEKKVLTGTTQKERSNAPKRVVCRTKGKKR